MWPVGIDLLRHHPLLMQKVPFTYRHSTKLCFPTHADTLGPAPDRRDIGAAMAEQTPLLIDVFTVPSRPLIRPLVPPPPPGGFTWAPITATLISGERDAVLVDTLVTVDDANALADWVEAKGKRVIAIYVTHS